jgi:non-ribosomal peptide synthetase-like protein
MNHAVIQSPSEERHADAFPRLLHEYFERQAMLRPQHAAVICNGETLTYAQLDTLANLMARALRARGVGPGALVGIYMKKSCRLFVAILGVLKAGAGYVPVDPKFPVARIKDIFEDSAAAAVLGDAAFVAALAGEIAAEIIDVETELQREIPAVCTPVAAMPSDPSYVIYTSGSTGKPKGVVIEHRNALNFVKAMNEVYKPRGEDRVYQGFSVAFDASVEEIWAAFSVGATLVVPTEDVSRSALDVAEFIDAQQITIFSTVPSFLALIESDLASVRLLILGGEVCPPELVNRWAQPTRRMLNTYGPTEATVVATLSECRAGAPVTIGKPLPGYSTHVLDEQCRPVTPGECGELYIGGDSVARGYLNRPELNAERFIADPFSTGDARLYRTCDLVRETETGDLHFMGRADGQVKVRGFRIELSEIEALLMEHPAIRLAAAKVVDIDGMKEIAAYVVLETTEPFDLGAVAEMMRGRVPEYMVPKYLETLNELPTLTSGKIDRNAFPEPKTLFGVTNRALVAPATPLEAAIADVWARNFRLEAVSVEDDFFVHLHGHSMIAGKIVSDLRKTLLTTKVSVRDLYSHKTVRALAGHLAGLGVGIGAEAGAAEQEPAAVAVAQPPLTAGRWICVAMQFVSLLAYYAVISAPAAYSLVTVLQAVEGEITWAAAALILTVVGFALWPSWLLLSIGMKWLVIGRYRPGRYPVWGSYYFRWWLAGRFQALSLSGAFAGTPLMSLYYRAMGAKVGANCTIGTALCSAFDMVSIGDDTSIGGETHIFGYRLEDGWLIIEPVSIGNECFVGMHCYLGLGVTMGDRAQLDDMSVLPDGAVMAVGEARRGSPAQITTLDLPAAPADRKRGALRYGLAHLALIYAGGYFLILAAAPLLGLVAYALYVAGPLGGIVAAFGLIPFGLLWYLAVVVAAKWLIIGQIRPGLYQVRSGAYLRYWLMNWLLSTSRGVLLPIYATLYFPSILRLLGAKVGGRSEISTIMHVMPDLLEIEEGCFLADACIVGGGRVHNGYLELKPNRIGRRTFVGNSAFVPEGVDLGDNALIGVLSTPPAGVTRTPDDARWLGSPGFQLPATQKPSCFGAAQTYEPTRLLVGLRATIDAFRILLPNAIAVALLVGFISAVAAAYYTLPLVALIAIVPVVAMVLSIVAVAVVAGLKNLIAGRFEPTVKPLWCSYVWLNEVVNALYETIAAPALQVCSGTPFIASGLRLMGCKIGRWTVLETTLFSEFDLVEIGDRVTLGQGVTIQTHLFEDRIMKADRVKIGDECSVGNMAVVLYSTEMGRGAVLGPLSVLMKGESLPRATRWCGIPSQMAEGVVWSSPRADGVAADAIRGEMVRQLRGLLLSSSSQRVLIRHDNSRTSPDRAA